MRKNEAVVSLGFHFLTLALLIFSSFLFIFYEQAHFDSDQAISGLMAKHLAEGRHFPIFTYGAKYILGFETWLAAPFMWLWGASVATLKIPLLILNAVTLVILIKSLRVETSLPWKWTFLSLGFFILPSPIAASRIIHAAIGVPTSFLACLLVRKFWNRPWILGALLGFVIPVRPFLLFAVGAMGILEWTEDKLFTRKNFHKWMKTGSATLLLMVLIKVWGRSGPNFEGPSVPAFVLKDPLTLWRSLVWLFGENIPTLFGLKPERLLDFNLNSRLQSGRAWMTPVFAVGILTFVLRSLVQARAGVKTRLQKYPFPAFLMLTGGLNLLIYTAFVRNGENIMLIRYTLMAIYLPIGYVAYYYKTETNSRWRNTFACFIVLWLGQNLWDQSRLVYEYKVDQPVNAYRDLANFLEVNHWHYGQANFWTSEHLTFFSRESVKVSANDFARINEYVPEIAAHPEEAVLISDGTCPRPEAGVAFQRWCVTPRNGEIPGRTDH